MSIRKTVFAAIFLTSSLAYASDQDFVRAMRQNGVTVSFGKILSSARSVVKNDARFLDASLLSRTRKSQVKLYFREPNGRLVAVRVNGRNGKVLAVSKGLNAAVQRAFGDSLSKNKVANRARGRADDGLPGATTQNSIFGISSDASEQSQNGASIAETETPASETSGAASTPGESSSGSGNGDDGKGPGGSKGGNGGGGKSADGKSGGGGKGGNGGGGKGGDGKWWRRRKRRRRRWPWINCESEVCKIMRLLVVEDDLDLARQISTELSREGFTIDLAHNGEDACHLGETENYDAIVLDLGLPIMDGTKVLEEWRDAEVRTPVIILTARGRWQDRVDGLNAGGDDYLVKPFHMEELIARLNALIRRSAGVASTEVKLGSVTLKTETGRVFFGDKPVELTSSEFKLLTTMMLRPDKVHSKFELSEKIYGYHEERESNTVEVYIARLRNKLGKEFIKTIRGRGYTIGLA